MKHKTKIISFCSPGNPFREEINRYRLIIRPYSELDIFYCKSAGINKTKINSIKKSEENTIKKKLNKKSFPVALSEEGRTFTSESFSKWISKINGKSSELTFIIGGAYGISDTMKKDCEEVISLSSMTFCHRICIVILLEQIYRAYTILKGHPYHK